MPKVSPSALEPTIFAPLPLPQAHLQLQRIRKQLRTRLSPSPAALVPLFYAALLYLGGILVTHFVYLRPGLLLISLPLLAVVAIAAILRAPRLVWLPIAVLWLVLGTWSAETEPEPGPNLAITSLSDGLLRTVEGIAVSVEPLRHPSESSANEDSDANAYESGNYQYGDAPLHTRLTQQIDMQVTAAEKVTDTVDRLQVIPEGPGTQIRLTVYQSAARPAEIVCGDRLRVVIRLQSPEVFHDPGVWDRAAYLETQNISATAGVDASRRDSGEPRLAVVDTRGRRSLACTLSQFRNRASSRLQSLPAMSRRWPRALRATSADAAMLTALLTGDRAWLNRGSRVGFERTGSFHLVVVSGLHLAILAGVVFAAAKRLRLGRYAATIVTLSVSLGYAVFTGFAIPVQRSFWMIALYLIGRLLYRHRNPLNVLGFATLCLAAASPRSIFDASFQMTLLAVGAIAGIAAPLLAPTLHARVRATHDLHLVAIDVKLPPKIAQFRVSMRLLAENLGDVIQPWAGWRLLPSATRLALRLGELFVFTTIVELALALPMAMYFHRITVYALPVNLCILPMLGILAPAAMVLLLTLMLWPAAAMLPAAASLAMLHLSLLLIHHLGTLAMADFRIPEPGWLQICAALALFVLALQLARLGWSRFPNLGRWLAMAAMLLMAIVTLIPRPVKHPAHALLFEAIDVGQGDALLLITADGKTLLIDGGGLGLPFLTSRRLNAESSFDTGDEIVSALLWSRGIRRLDAVALTHAHHDHMGGLPAVLRNFRPRELWVGENPPAVSYLDLLHEADSLGIAVRRLHAGQTLALGTASLRVLAPAPEYRPGAQPGNNDSLVLQAAYGETSVLLAGDAEASEEQTMLAGFNLRSAVLKVGHHGSRSSTRPAFLSAVAPAWAVISCGRHNRFGHPREEVLAELQAAHVKTYRTDLDGATCFALDGLTVRVETACGWSSSNHP